jgi:hypothetical protein
MSKRGTLVFGLRIKESSLKLKKLNKEVAD